MPLPVLLTVKMGVTVKVSDTLGSLSPSTFELDSICTFEEGIWMGQKDTDAVWRESWGLPEQSCELYTLIRIDWIVEAENGF